MSPATTSYRNVSCLPAVTETYAACRVREPIVSASCGAPVTATVRLNVTSTSICSLSPYVLPPAGLLWIDTPLTDAAVNVPPATRRVPSLLIAWCARLSSASVVPPATSIVPPFSAKALAPMLNPSVSASACATTYRNTSAVVPVPDA